MIEGGGYVSERSVGVAKTLLQFVDGLAAGEAGLGEWRIVGVPDPRVPAADLVPLVGGLAYDA